MKKLLCIISFLVGSFALFAQNPNAYRFSCDTTSYTELTGATVVGQKLLGANLDSKWIVGDTGYAALTTAPAPDKRDSIMNGRGMAIGFDLQFGTEKFSHFGLLSNGAIFLGKHPDSIFVGTVTSGPLNASHVTNVISFAVATGYLRSFDETIPGSSPITEISYKVEGVDGNRTLTVQFKNLLFVTAGTLTSPTNKDTVNFQIILHENGQIVYHIGKSVATNTTARSFYVGFKSLTSTAPNYYTRSINSATSGANGLQTWGNTILGSSASATSAFMSVKYPTEGLRYTFDTPSPCSEPDPIRNSFTFSTLTTTTFKYNLKQNPSSNGSLVIFTKEPVLTGTPVNGKIYKNDQDTIGNGLVSGVSTSTTSAIEGTVGFVEGYELLPGTKYYVHAYALNSLCVGDQPVYSATAVTDSIVTLPGLTKLSLVSNDSTSAKMALKPFKDYSAVIFKRSTYSATATAPTKAMEIGETLSDGSVLVYKGNLGEVQFTDLESGSLNYFTSWTLATDSTYGPDFSTIGVQMNATKLPFTFNFADQANGEAAGWKGDFNIFTTKNPTYTLLSASISKCTAGGDTCILAPAFKRTGLSSPFKLSTGKQRISFDYIVGLNGFEGGGRPPVQNPMVGVALPDRDSLIVSLSTDNINFTPIGYISSESHTTATADFTTKAIDFDIADLDSKQVQLRFEAVSKREITYSYFIKNLKIQQVLTDCETPSSIGVIDSSISSTEAQIKWTDFAGTTYKEWNISYKKTSDKNWSEAINVKANPYLLTYLDPQSSYEARVQAVCTRTESSEWSTASTPFMTQYGVPFGANFEKASWDLPSLPIYWSRLRAELPETGAASSFVEAPTSWMWWHWKNQINGNENALRCAFGATSFYWFTTPAFDLKENNGVVLNFDLALLEGTGDKLIDTVNANSRFLVVVSTDGGETFHTDNTLLAYGKGSENKLGAIDKHISLSLGKYSGKVKIGFYLENSDPNGIDAYIQLANLSIAPNCLAATKPVVSSIKETSATLAWQSPSPAQKWILRYKAESATEYSYVEAADTSYILNNLTPATAYEWGVKTVCAVDDSSAWISANFSTLTPYVCDTVTRARRIDYDRTFAQIAWVGEAYSYNFKYKKLSSTDWIQSTTTDTTIILNDLEMLTEYTFSVQAQCSETATDTSLWTTPGKFKTLGITCSVPDSIRVNYTKFMSANIKWKSVATAYQYSFKTTEEDRWENGFIDDYSGIVINGLIPETDYEYKMRTICTTGDTSEWSPILEFRTTAIPQCGVPVDIRFGDVTSNSVELSWNAGLNNILYNVHGREASKMAWDTVFTATNQTHFIWTNLKAETAYTWRIQGICDTYFLYNVLSTWSSNQEFSTNPTSIEGESDLKNAFQIGAKNGQLHILNLLQKRIDKVEIFNTAGQTLRNYQVNSSDNVIIPTTLSSSMVIVRITSQGSSVSYKIYL